MRQARLYISQGLSTVQVAYSTEDAEDSLVSLLNIRSPSTSHLSEDIALVAFGANERRFLLPPVESLQLHHYKITSKLYPFQTHNGNSTEMIIMYQQHAELLLQCRDTAGHSSGGAGPHYSIHIHHTTQIVQADSPRTIILADCLCMSENTTANGGYATPIRCTSIHIEFLTATSARTFLTQIQLMQRELFILYLQYARCREQIVFSRPTGNTMIRDHYILDSRLSVVFNPSSGEYRVILLSGTHASSVCIEYEFPRL